MTSVQEDVESTEESEYDYISTQLKGKYIQGCKWRLEEDQNILKMGLQSLEVRGGSKYS